MKNPTPTALLDSPYDITLSVYLFFHASKEATLTLVKAIYS